MEAQFRTFDVEFSKALGDRYPALEADYPLAAYLAEIKTFDYHEHYEEPSREAKATLDAIQDRFGIEAVALFQKRALCHLILEAIATMQHGHPDNDLRRLLVEWFEHVHDDFSHQPDAYYDHRKLFPLVRMDLAICSRRAIPVGGAWLVAQTRMNQAEKIGSATMAKGDGDAKPQDRSPLREGALATLDTLGLRETARKAKTSVQEALGRYEDFYEIHTVDRNIRDFTRAHMDVAYGNIVKLLELSPNISGVFRQSWFLDPEIKNVSPELSYLWEVPLAHGAELHCAGPVTVANIPKITATSPIRRKLYADGQYTPKNYFYFWPRDAIIKMATESK